MSCLGPRKKDKKAASPPSGERKPLRNANGKEQPKAYTMPASVATGKSSPASRLNNGIRQASATQRAASPNNQRLSATSARSIQSRNDSVTSVRKSPVAQLREDYDTLRIKNKENEDLIAKQRAELEQLKLELAQQSQQTLRSDRSGPTPPMSQSTTQSDFSLLQQTEEKLKKREEEVDTLRKQLDQLPTTVARHESEYAEKKQALTEKERELTEQLAQANPSMEEMERQLKEKEEELSQLRAQKQMHDLTLETVDDLRQQLEDQQREHSEQTRQHEEAMAKKDQLLKEHKEALDMLRESHGDELKELRSSQTTSLIQLKAQHQADTEDIRQRLMDAEKRMAKDPAARFDDDVERLLAEFEQAEHNHTVEMEQLESSHKEEMSHLQGTHVSQLENLRKRQDESVKNWTQRFVPTDAVSWPAPIPIASLRKTNGAGDRKPRPSLSNGYTPVVTPLDTSKVQVYISSISGNLAIKKNQELIQQLLRTQQVPFELVDIALSETALQHMKRCNNQGSVEGRAKEVPQLFVGGQYRGQCEDVARAIEDNALEALLVPAPERTMTAEEKAAIQKAEHAAAMATASDPANAVPVRVLPPGPVPKASTLRKTRPITLDDNDDDRLLDQLAKEIESGKISAADVEAL